MRALWTIVPGVLLVCFALREVFRDLFHPTWRGSPSDYVARTLFALCRGNRSLLSLAGPLALVVVIACWVLLLALGFAMIYWTAYPGGFRWLSAQHSGTERGLLRTLYFSLQSMTSLGFGDLVPERDWLRLTSSLEALIGFGLLTASVSSIVLIYPALGRMRTLARRTSILQKASESTGVEVVSEHAEILIGELALDVIRTRVDFIHFPIIYYFHAARGRSSLPATLPILVQYAEAGSRLEAPERIRLISATLHAALQDLADVLADRFVKADGQDAQTVFRAYAAHHLTGTEVLNRSELKSAS